jgi:hypothetical protein
VTWVRTLLLERRLFAVIVLACALLARVAVPSGFMIGTDAARGTPVIEICAGQGPMQIAMPGTAEDHHEGGKDHQAADHPCAFAAAAAAIDLAAIIHPLAPATATIAPALLPPVDSRPGQGLAAPPPPKTGPPAFA